ncbi:MAG TPA: hemerythrin domain-containing protein [Methylomirabilota bacterium]|jgi:hemerythrin superfamily protein
MRATELLSRDHRAVRDLFLQFERTPLDDGPSRQDLFDRIVEELDVHAQAEEEVFYPAVRQASRRVDDAQAGHAHLRAVIREVKTYEPGSSEFTAGVRLVKRIVLAHVMEEEGGVFVDAERMGTPALERLGAQLAERKEALARTVRRAA